MRQPEPPEYDPPVPGETLQQWLTGSSQDWIHAQPTMWMPAVPAEPAAPPSLEIPTQRGSDRAGRRRAVNGAARSGPAMPPGVTRHGAEPRPRSGWVHDGTAAVHLPRAAWTALVGAALAFGLALIPSAGAAAVAMLVGGWFTVVALSRLRRTPTGAVPARGSRALGRTVLAAALVVAAVAVGMGGSAVWAAVNSTGVPG